MKIKNISKLAKKTMQNKFNKVVIWGLKKFTPDSFRYIFHSFNSNLLKLNIPVMWCEDKVDNNTLISKGDLVLAVGHASKHLSYIKGVYYCLHNFEEPVFRKFKDRQNTIKLQVYTTACEKYITQKISKFAGFDTKNRVLYQPWGTDLLPEEFAEPVFPSYSPFVFWVGNIWDNDLGQGNVGAITQLKSILVENRLKFIHVKYVPDQVNKWLIRNSRIAPAIAGKWQVENNYLPCRMFKNISYGQLGISNVDQFSEIVGKKLANQDMSAVISYACGLKKRDYLQLIKEQQNKIQDYTYASSLLNIVNCF